MTLTEILGTLLLGPLKLVFEVIFTLANQRIGHPGLAIMVLSLSMNILVLPLYRRADAMQEAARDRENQLREGIAHIKKHFSGDERMMILQAYYRQNNYSPLSALNGSVSLLLEIPFFMAAYQFLSALDLLNGVSLGPIQDLGAPDGMLVLGSMSINLLPVLMTLINLISSAIYLKGFPLKTKIQLYAMALFFLVFLYDSPAGLVFYWTLNNIFSLGKTLVYRLPNPKKAGKALTALMGLLITILGVSDPLSPLLLRLLIGALGLGLLLSPILPRFLAKWKLSLPQSQPDRKIFFLGGLLLTIQTGMLIPSTFLSASPQEFVDVTMFHDPVWYIVSATCLAAGTFLIWMGVFYWLASPNGKSLMDKALWVLCGVMLVNYMFFGTDLGVISASLQYERDPRFTNREQLLNLAVLAVLSAGMLLTAWKKPKLVTSVLLTVAISMSAMSIWNVNKIRTSVEQLKTNSLESAMPSFRLSTTGKNVVVLMLDRAMGLYAPYILEELPEVREQFAGFTYYDNTISFGGTTNFATPALFGGYDYTPVEMNRRDTLPLVEKHNEALKLMPKLFSDAGFEVTVCDPVYANYQWIPDLSIFEDLPQVRTFLTRDKFLEPEQKSLTIANNHRNFFCFSLMRSMPLCLQPTLYNSGWYNQSLFDAEGTHYTIQSADSVSTAYGISASFMNDANVLASLPKITTVTEENCNTYLSMVNALPHQPTLLQAPSYTPAQIVDNRQYDESHTDRFTLNGRTLKMETTEQMAHYHANAATYILLGEWFDYLREQGVYDNTRIILVADHGYQLSHLDTLYKNDGQAYQNIERYFPLLMVKDFDANAFSTSHAFMTNADVPTLALADLIHDPVNPYTGNPINSDAKTSHDQYIIMSWEWDLTKNNGNTYMPSSWASVREDLWADENWGFSLESTILTEHSFP